MSDFRDDIDGLREYLKDEKGYTDHDLQGINSERVCNDLYKDFQSHKKVQSQKRAKQNHDKKVQAIVNDTKRSPQARINDLLTIGDSDG